MARSPGLSLWNREKLISDVVDYFIFHVTEVLERGLDFKHLLCAGSVLKGDMSLGVLAGVFLVAASSHPLLFSSVFHR